jgi:ribosomal protein S18 acetylase RimI-like enzyme
MGLTVTMAFNGMADFEDNGVLKVAGAAWEVRRAGLSDVAAILSVERHSGRRPVDLPVMEAAVVDPARHVVVASLDGSVIGWAKTHHWEYPDGPAPSGHYLGGISVLPAWRRLGVGTVLTEARMRWIWARAADAWYVVNTGNVPSINLHRRWNFTEVARSPTFHTTTFPGGPGILLRAQRPEAQRHVGGAPTVGDGTVGDGTGGAPTVGDRTVGGGRVRAG